MSEDKSSGNLGTQTLAEIVRDENGDFCSVSSKMIVHPELLDSVIMCSELGKAGVRRMIGDDLYQKNSKGRVFSGRVIPDEADSYFIGDEKSKNENKNGVGIVMYYHPVSYCKTK